MNENNYNALHFTHNDTDAVGCALIADLCDNKYTYKTYFNSISNINNDLISIIDEEINNNTINCIMFTDISITEENCKELEELCQKHNIELIGIDHHKTNELNEKYDWWHVCNDNKTYRPEIDMNTPVSATYLLYNYYLEKELPSPNLKNNINDVGLLANIISDYDTWEWKRISNDIKYAFNIDGNSITVTYDRIVKLCDMISKLCKFLGCDEAHNILYNHYKNTRVTNTKYFYTNPVPTYFNEIYKALNNKESNYFKSLPEKVKIYFNGITYALLISENDFSNSAANHIFDIYDKTDIVIVIYPVTKTLSLRTRRDYIDVAKIAKDYFNGGGHKQAAGGRFKSNDDFLNFMNIYLNSTLLNDIMEEH